MEAQTLKTADLKLNLNDTTREVLVFSTSIKSKDEVEKIKAGIDSLEGVLYWNVDLDDWEKILRVEGIGVAASEIMNTLYKYKIYSRELAD